jgi:DNA-binding transcriptional MerR regulator
MAGNMYRIGQAAKMLDLNTSVLRYWETEFPQLEPVRTGKGQRLYTDAHIELLTLIKRLVHEDGMTIEGARKKLETEGEMAGLKRLVVDELKAMKQILESGESSVDKGSYPS